MVVYTNKSYALEKRNYKFLWEAIAKKEKETKGLNFIGS